MQAERIHVNCSATIGYLPRAVLMELAWSHAQCPGWTICYTMVSTGHRSWQQLGQKYSQLKVLSRSIFYSMSCGNKPKHAIASRDSKIAIRLVVVVAQEWEIPCTRKCVRSIPIGVWRHCPLPFVGPETSHVRLCSTRSLEKHLENVLMDSDVPAAVRTLQLHTAIL